MRGGLVLLALALTGCLAGGPSGEPLPSTEPPAEARPAYRDALCANGLLFQFVDYAVADAYLPPGFHPRDPRGFLGTPAAFGRAGVLFVAVDCVAPEGPLQAAFIAIFVEAPQVPGEDRVPFDFYEVARYGSPGEMGGALAEAGWPILPATVRVEDLGAAGQSLDSQAVVEDALGPVVQLNGDHGALVQLGDGPVRFWHDTPEGLAYLRYDSRLDALVGSGLCQVRPGSPLTAFVGQPVVGQVSCLPAPVLATLVDLRPTVTLHRLPGVEAG